MAAAPPRPDALGLIPLLRNLYAYRSYIGRNAWSEFRYRYAGTGIGFFWTVLNPLVQVVIYTTVFGLVLQLRGHRDWGSFGLFLCAGVMPWASFTESLVRGSQALVRNAAFLRTLPVPHEAVVAQSSLTSFFGLFVTLALLAPIAVWQGRPPRAAWLLLPVVGLLLHALAFGLSLGLASLRVFFPDVSEALRLALQFWLWTMPIVYRENVLPGGRAPWWMEFNPPYVFVRSIRDLVVDQRATPLATWLLMVAWAALAIGASAGLSRRLQAEVQDAL